MGITAPQAVSQNLFDAHIASSAQAARLMAVLDRANRRYGKDTLVFASSAMPSGRWQMQRQRKTQAYTTRWGEIPLAG